MTEIRTKLTRNGFVGSAVQMDAFAEDVSTDVAAGQVPLHATLENVHQNRQAKSSNAKATCALKLPVSQTIIQCHFKLLNADQCLVSPVNRRIQRLLTPENAEVMALVDSIRLEGQRDPVLARPVQINGKTRYEIVYGTRRRIAVSLLAKGLTEGLQLKAWVADTEISDADANRLAKSENENRAAISSWETAQYLKAELARNPDWTHEMLAKAENMSRTLVTRYLLLADIDEIFVRLLRSPGGMTLTGGLAIRGLSTQHGPDRLAQAIEHIRDAAPFVDTGSLVTALRQALATKRKGRDVKVPIQTNSGTVRGQMVQHRSKAGCYKIDLLGVSEEQASKVKAAIEVALS